MMLLIHALALFGCTGSADSPADTGTEDSGTADTDSGTVSDSSGDYSGEVDGECEESTGVAIAYTTLYNGSVESETFTASVDARLFDTEADWSAFLSGLTLAGEVAAVDFSTQQVATAFVVVPSTCGLTAGDVVVTQATSEAIHVDLVVTDTSGACDTACSMVGQALVAVAIPRDAAGDPTVCARRADGGC